MKVRWKEGGKDGGPAGERILQGGGGVAGAGKTRCMYRAKGAIGPQEMLNGVGVEAEGNYRGHKIQNQPQGGEVSIGPRLVRGGEVSTT